MKRIHSLGINGEGELRGSRLIQVHLENGFSTECMRICIVNFTIKPTYVNMV